MSNLNTTVENASIIKLQDLNKRFSLAKKEIVALENITMDIAQGSIVGIIGRSGAGKSTLLRCMNNLEKPDSGIILFENQNLTQASSKQLRKIRQQIGMIFQQFNLLARRTVLENVTLPLEIANYPKDKLLTRAKECLKFVGLSDRENAYPNDLSGGQKQRVAIARALASQAKVLLCDEATSSLDPETTAEILHLLRDLNKRLKITIVLITHEINVIRDICDYVFVMDHGKIVEQGVIENIFATPTHPITRSFINSMVSSNIPEVIKTLLVNQPEGPNFDIVLRLIFRGGSAEKPILSHFIRNYGTDINIAAGYLDHIGQSTFGTLIVTLPNKKDVIQNATEFLASQGVKTETLGFIPQNG